MSARADHRARVYAGMSEPECWAALFDEVDRLESENLALKVHAERLATELALHGWGDFHWNRGDEGQKPEIVALLDAHRALIPYPPLDLGPMELTPARMAVINEASEVHRLRSSIRELEALIQRARLDYRPEDPWNEQDVAVLARAAELTSVDVGSIAVRKKAT